MPVSSSVIEPVDRSVEELQRLCRGPLRHAWDLYSPLEPPSGGSWRGIRNRLYLRCLRCSTARHDGLDVHGGLIVREYKYPDGYKMTVDERPTTEQLRMWMLKRQRVQMRSTHE